MSFLPKFAKLMQSERDVAGPKSKNSAWIIDESKCLQMNEVEKLREAGKMLLTRGLEERRFSWIRTWFMIELGLHTGLRVGEMASLHLTGIFINGDKSSLSVIGKGGKKRQVWLNTHIKEVIHQYLQIKALAGYESKGSHFLLVNHRGSSITTRALQKWFKIALELANLPCHYHIHCLRHTYATFLLKASNHNYRFVQRQLGHASIKTTQVYAGIIESEGRDAIEKLYR